MTPEELKNSILKNAFSGGLSNSITFLETGIDYCNKTGIKIYKNDNYQRCNIPDSWCLVNICNCGKFISGYTPKSNELCGKGKIPYFKVSDMNSVGNETRLINTNAYLINEKTRTFPANTIVYPKNGGAIFTNKKRYLVMDSVVDLNTGGYILNDGLYFMYFWYYFQTIDFRFYFKGTALPTIDMDKVKDINVPIPSLEEQKHIVAKIEELLPLVVKYEEAWNKLEKLNKEFPISLEKSIFQYAIQGKLVEQRDDEGTGEELLKCLTEKKNLLIKEKMIKKCKALSPITDEEKPFDIPNNWKWCRLRALCTKIVDGDHNPPKGSGVKTEYLMLSAININHDTLEALDKVRYLDKKTFLLENERTKIKKGDILFTIVGTLGRSCLYDGLLNICFQRSVSVITTLIDNKYLKFVLDSPYIHQYMIENSTGTAQKGFYLNQVENLLIPLPPLKEQERIAKKIEELLPYLRMLNK